MHADADSVALKRPLRFLILLAVGYVAWYGSDPAGALGQRRGPTPAPESSAEQALAPALEPAAGPSLAQAFRDRATDLQVSGAGVVTKLLPDDNDGSRHQRFLLRVADGTVVLVAHNIDLAPRLSKLRVGDQVEFHGVYEWNQKGGVVHWTHHDPQGHHEAGWLKHRGELHQ